MITNAMLNIIRTGSTSALVRKSAERLSQIALDKLQSAGIWRDRSCYFLNIAYPSLQAMGLIDANTIYTSSFQSNSRNVALYIHIPFCTAECYYCHYYKKFAQSVDQVDKYLDSIGRELYQYTRILGDLHVKSIYIGGGTPSYLTPQQIERLFDTIRRYTSITPGIEISFEIHPESATAERMHVLVQNGVNRINIGVESFEDRLLANENRRHTSAQVIEAYQIALQANLTNINLDLIYGLKGQSLEGWEYNLDAVNKLQPASTTMYYLRLKRGTPEYKLWKLHKETFPSDMDLLLMHAMSFERMEEELGYRQMPVDWFVRSDQFFHQYQDYNWRRSDEVELLGLGASAYSYIDGWQYYNMNDIQRYQDSLERGDLPIWRAEHLDGEERMRRTLMLGLKIGINRGSFSQLYGYDVINAFAPVWERLVDLNLVEILPETVQLTYSGKLFADEVGQQFYSDSMKQRMAAIDPELVSTTWPQFNS